MILIVDELRPDAYQTVTRDRHTIVEAVRPHLYRHLWPAGSVRAVIEDDAGNTVATGDWVDIANIGDENYFHGYVTLYVDAYLSKDTNYRIKVEAGNGYTYAATAYLGVCNGYDLGRYPAIYTTGTSGYLHPLDIEIWERKA